MILEISFLGLEKKTLEKYLQHLKNIKGSRTLAALMAIKRLSKEFRDITSLLPIYDDDKETMILSNVGPRIGLTGDPVNMFEWRGLMYGPKNTPYEGGIFVVDIQLPPDYPFKPPKSRLLTRICHPDFDSKGRQCFDIDKDQCNYSQENLRHY